MKTAFVIAVLILVLVSSIALADVPPMINYQGKLLQPSGAPVADGTYQMTFSIYNVATGGTALWTETNPSVQVKGGLFAALLGSVINLPANTFNTTTLFFGVKVGNDPEMTPRQQIASTAFAFRSSVAGTVDDGAITTSKIADGSVTATKLSTSAVLLGCAQTSTDFQTTSQNSTQVPGLSATVNVPTGGRAVKITVSVAFLENTTGGYACLDLWDGPVGTGTQLEETIAECAPSQSLPASIIYVQFPAAGTKTYNVGLRCIGGNADMTCGGKAMILVEAL